LSGVGNLVRLDGAYLRMAQSRDSDGLALECKKLDGVALATLMYHDNCPDVACLQAILRERLQQHNPIKRLHHLLSFQKITQQARAASMREDVRTVSELVHRADETNALYDVA
jgi:hypothetical protein